jgi:hypothetical protein
MKKYLFTIVALMILLNGCDRQIKRVNRKYVIENGTEKEVKIELYKYGNLTYTATIKGRGILYEGISDNDVGKTISAYNALRSDSAIVTFDHLKEDVHMYVYTPGIGNVIIPETRNVFLDSSYFPESNTLYRFTFTEEDYNNAEPIIAE